MSRRRLHLVIALLLPLLALRALLPAGYMPSADAGGVRMVLCSAGLAALSTPDDGSHPARSHAGDDCLFAHAALNAPPPHRVDVAAAVVPDGRFVVPLASAAPPSAGPPRQGGARAPPVLL